IIHAPYTVVKNLQEVIEKQIPLLATPTIDAHALLNSTFPTLYPKLNARIRQLEMLDLMDASSLMEILRDVIKGKAVFMTDSMVGKIVKKVGAERIGLQATISKQGNNAQHEIRRFRKTYPRIKEL